MLLYALVSNSVYQPNQYMKKLFTLFLLIFLLEGVSYAQQDPQVSHNMYNQLAVNPGYAGISNAICGTLIARKQWLGFEGSPQTGILSVDAPIRLLHGGAGLTILSDKLGFENNIGVKLSYAYRTNRIGPGSLGIGLQLDLLNKSIDFSKFKPIDNGDQLLVPKSKEGAMLIDFTLGAYYNIEGKMYAGISATQMRQAKGQFGNADAAPNLKRHYYINAGYNYQMNASIELQPSIFVKTDFVSAQYDFNVIGVYDKRFWAGLTYRTQDAVAVLLGLHWKDFKFGYAYDFTTSQMGRKGRSSGSHELMLGYCFKIVVERPPTSSKTTRFL